MASSSSSFFIFLLLIFTPASLSTFASSSKTPSKLKPDSPLSPKSSLLRYWNRKIPNNKPQPLFFTLKLSPLSPFDFAKYSSFSSSQLSSSLFAFCASARILCTSYNNLTASFSSHDTPSHFSVYVDSNFTNYADKAQGFSNSFKNYSNNGNVNLDTFRRYSRSSLGDSDSFGAYSLNGNVVTANFTSYSGGQLGGSGKFSNYQSNSNVPDLKFTNYDTKAFGPKRDFKTYTKNTNAGDEKFSSYGKDGGDVSSKFSGYGENSNVIGSGFTSYEKNARIANDLFTSYGVNGNVPENNFKGYGENAIFPADVFRTYRNQSNVGDDFFSNYGKGAAGEEASFSHYGESFNTGSDNFDRYGENTTTDVFNFTTYAGELTDFKGYENNVENGNRFNFKSYVNASTVPHSDEVKAEQMKVKRMSGRVVHRWLVEPGKFFREHNLKKGNIIPMPDVRDKMPARSFLPQAIASKIAFTAENVRTIFAIPEDTAMGKAVSDTINDCNRAPSKGETKTCGTSAEDIIDFAVSVLGPDVVVRSTENTKGSKKDIMIGDVKGINGGEITKSVSCHQSLFPYLVYYCHSVPKVRVYEADILDVESKEKINHGVAICHIDTSDWSAGHGAFLSLGYGPGRIEVCHWIFEGDMTWARAD